MDLIADSAMVSLVAASWYIVFSETVVYHCVNVLRP